jgi:hypothetical protein
MEEVEGSSFPVWRTVATVGWSERDEQRRNTLTSVGLTGKFWSLRHDGPISEAVKLETALREEWTVWAFNRRMHDRHGLNYGTAAEWQFSLCVSACQVRKGETAARWVLLCNKCQWRSNRWAPLDKDAKLKQRNALIKVCFQYKYTYETLVRVNLSKGQSSVV